MRYRLACELQSVGVLARSSAELRAARAGTVYVQAAWVPPPPLSGATPGEDHAASGVSVTRNPMFASENVADAFVMDLPLAPPPPRALAAAQGESRMGRGNAKFAEARRCGAVTVNKRFCCWRCPRGLPLHRAVHTHEHAPGWLHTPCEHLFKGSKSS